MKKLLYLLVVMFVMATVALMPAKGQADNWVRYDRFNSCFINPGKWYGQERGQDSLREFIRNIKGGKLRMALVGYSDTGSDDGSRFTRNGVRFVEEVARTMTALKARIRVNHFYVMDCDTNDSSQSMIRSRIGGIFFHDGNVSVPPSSLEGDIFADIRIWKQIDGSGTSKHRLEITYRLSVCSDPDCNDVEDIASETVRTIRREKWITLGIEWVPERQGFVFQYGSRKDFVEYPDTVDPVFPTSGSDIKFLRVEANILNCTSKPRPMYLMDTYFDNVYIKTADID